MRAHLRDLYVFYGEAAGVRIARKHIGWYCRDRADAQLFRQSVMQVATAEAQLALVHEYFATLDGTAAAAA
jgi:tRNA-dihydrouridine synthase B